MPKKKVDQNWWFTLALREFLNFVLQGPENDAWTFVDKICQVLLGSKKIRGTHAHISISLHNFLDLQCTEQQVSRTQPLQMQLSYLDGPNIFSRWTIVARCIEKNEKSCKIKMMYVNMCHDLKLVGSKSHVTRCKQSFVFCGKHTSWVKLVPLVVAAALFFQALPSPLQQDISMILLLKFSLSCNSAPTTNASTLTCSCDEKGTTHIYMLRNPVWVPPKATLAVGEKKVK